LRFERILKLIYSYGNIHYVVDISIHNIKPHKP